MNSKLITMSLFMGLAPAILYNSQNGNTGTIGSKGSAVENTADIKEEPVTYNVDGKNFNGYVTYDSKQQGKRPAVLVVHEWWGLNDYPRSRAKQLAQLGYIAMAVDMYGDGKTGDDPKSAQALATPYYKDPTLSKIRLDAAIAKLKTFPQTDTSKMAAIGYAMVGLLF